jgi:hypothetical protein
MLLFGQHEHCEDEFRGEDCLNDQAARNACIRCKRGSDVEIGREKCLDNERCDDSANELGADKKEAACVGDRLCHYHAERHGGICDKYALGRDEDMMKFMTLTKQTAADAEKDPNVDH